jgi:hypothetical protein
MVCLSPAPLAEKKNSVLYVKNRGSLEKHDKIDSDVGG